MPLKHFMSIPCRRRLATTFRKFKDEGGNGRAPRGPYPGPPLGPLEGAAGEVEMHEPAKYNGAGARGPQCS